MSGVRFLFIVSFPRDLRFRCQLCGRCCTGFDGGLTLELYPSDIRRIRSLGFRDFYYVGDDGRMYMKIRPGMPCPFYRDGLCLLMQRYGFHPWNCRAYPIQVVEHEGFFDVRINPSALEECPGFGVGPLLRETLLPEVIRGVISIKLTGDPRELPAEVALSLAEIRWPRGSSKASGLKLRARAP